MFPLTCDALLEDGCTEMDIDADVSATASRLSEYSTSVLKSGSEEAVMLRTGVCRISLSSLSTALTKIRLPRSSLMSSSDSVLSVSCTNVASANSLLETYIL